MKYLIKQFAITLILALMSINLSHALVPVGKAVTGSIALQGGTDSAVKYTAPATSAYKIHVLVPKAGTAVNALYRVYPKGKQAGSTGCATTDAKFPCYEVVVDQTLHQNAWVQLMLNDDATTQWEFVKGKGIVVAVADNLVATDLLNVSAQVRFEDMVRAIGKTYQGGIIFYVDNTGGHGLIAAPTDQSSAIQWFNGSYITTGATGTAVGTGLANTNKITKAQGAGSYAAKICANLVIGAYSGWYLPSKDELNLIYQNIGPGAVAPLTNVGGFAGAWYWSSSENGFGAWLQNFGGGGQVNSNKLNAFSVRAVRAF
jgi:hypothetical protein